MGSKEKYFLSFYCINVGRWSYRNGKSYWSMIADA